MRPDSVCGRGWFCACQLDELARTRGMLDCWDPLGWDVWGSEGVLLRTTWHKRGLLMRRVLLPLWVKPQWARTNWKKPLKCLEVISWPHIKGSVHVLGRHRQNGDYSHLETGDGITSHGECVQPLQSVNCLDSRAHGHERNGPSHD